MSKLLSTLRQDFPAVTFVAGDTFHWSPKKQTVFYVDAGIDSESSTWSLLHELGHAVLEHQTFQTDFDLLMLEVSAWDKALALGKQYGVTINPDHVQDCLDTYRDWLYQRSTCPACTSCSLQIDAYTYSCFNCNMSWRVSRSRLCRTYRKKQTTAALTV